jgi:hypothetical protein
LSPDRVVVLAGTFFGPAFLVSLVRTPAAHAAACFDFAAPRPAPLLTFLLPGLSGFCRALPLGCVPVLLGALPRLPPSDITALLFCFIPLLSAPRRFPDFWIDLRLAPCPFSELNKSQTAEESLSDG